MVGFARQHARLAGALPARRQDVDASLLHRVEDRSLRRHRDDAPRPRQLDVECPVADRRARLLGDEALGPHGGRRPALGRDLQGGEQRGRSAPVDADAVARLAEESRQVEQSALVLRPDPDAVAIPGELAEEGHRTRSALLALAERLLCEPHEEAPQPGQRVADRCDAGASPASQWVLDSRTWRSCLATGGTRCPAG
jgi:hypothetical protein